VVDLADIDFATLQTVAYSGTTLSGTLTVQDGTHVAQLNLLGNYLAATFTSASDGHGGTLITEPAGVERRRACAAALEATSACIEMSSARQ